MKKSRYTESQIITVLKEVDAGRKVEEVDRTSESDWAESRLHLILLINLLYDTSKVMLNTSI